MKYLLMMSRTGLEPATTALKDQNGLIAGVPFRDFSVVTEIPFPCFAPVCSLLGTDSGTTVLGPCESRVPVPVGLTHFALQKSVCGAMFSARKRAGIAGDAKVAGPVEEE